MVTENINTTILVALLGAGILGYIYLSKSGPAASGEDYGSISAPEGPTVPVTKKAESVANANAAIEGIVYEPNTNPLLAAAGITGQMTIYNPESGARWSGSKKSTSYLMGDSPEAAAWRSRYL